MKRMIKKAAAFLVVAVGIGCLIGHFAGGNVAPVAVPQAAQTAQMAQTEQVAPQAVADVQSEATNVVAVLPVVPQVNVPEPQPAEPSVTNPVPKVVTFTIKPVLKAGPVIIHHNG